MLTCGPVHLGGGLGFHPIHIRRGRRNIFQLIVLFPFVDLGVTVRERKTASPVMPGTGRIVPAGLLGRIMRIIARHGGHKPAVVDGQSFVQQHEGVHRARADKVG